MMAKKMSSISDTPKVASLVSGKTKTLVVNKKVPPSRTAPRSGSTTSSTAAVGQGGPPSDSSHLQARIADRAHELYTHRGGHHGLDCEDWFEAERQVLDEGC